MINLNIDNTNLTRHPERVTELLAYGDCFPLYVEIGPTNKCNHRCIFCALDWLSRKKITNIDKKILINNLENMAQNGVKSVMFAGEGEAILHPNIIDFVQAAKKYGLSVSMTLNGSKFNKELADNIMPALTWIRFSIDAGTSKTYSLIHRTNENEFNQLIKNVEYTSSICDKTKSNVSAQVLVIPQNINEIKTLASILRGVGVDMLQIKPYSHHPDSANNFSISKKDYYKLEEELKLVNSSPDFEIKFRKESFERIQDGINYSKCFAAPFFTLIDSKGNLIPCNLFYNNEEFTYGNLYKNNFNEIWKSNKREEVLKKMEEKGVSSCREGCRLDPSNRYLHSLLNKTEYQNFL